MKAEVEQQNEIIVKSSAELLKIKGGGVEQKETIEWLGYDVVLLGGWSLIEHGIFENRQLSLLNAKQINKYELFDDTENIDDFLAEYERLASLNRVDPLLDEPIILDIVHIGRPL